MNLKHLVFSAALGIGGCAIFSGPQIINMKPTEKYKVHDEATERTVVFYKGTLIESPFGYLGIDNAGCFVSVLDKRKNLWSLFMDSDCNGKVDNYIESKLDDKDSSNSKLSERKDNPQRFEKELDALFAEYRRLAFSGTKTYIP